jgi:adenine-specific DNA-methyltransferase
MSIGKIFFPKNGQGSPRKKYYKYEREEEGQSATNWWSHDQFGHNQGANDLLTSLFGYKNAFSNSKPIELLRSIFLIGNCKKQNILDFFSGSGTTAHAVINLNREDCEKRKYILVEQNNYFDTVLKPRIQKVVYSKDWKEGKPVSREGISHCFKYLRLESYEDVLNNLVFKQDSVRDQAIATNRELRRDYVLNYFLDVETQGSQSLLNIADFRDPTAYKMYIKKPGSESQTLQSIDLIETFN